jgi:hypothetical protein
MKYNITVLRRHRISTTAPIFLAGEFRKCVSLKSTIAVDRYARKKENSRLAPDKRDKGDKRVSYPGQFSMSQE